MAEVLSKLQSLTVEAGRTAVFVEKRLAEKTEILVGEGARVRHFRLHENLDHFLSVRLEKGASYEVVTLHRGNGDLNLSFDMAGTDSFCRSDVVYVLAADQRARIRSDIRHNADKTVSRQLVKGAVGGRGQAVFEGGIFIPYDRGEIDGAQQHRALLLSPDASVKAVPQLEIYADDVKCAHGSAIGTINQDQLFYLKTRGIDDVQARNLLTTAFLNEVLDGIEDENTREEFKRLAVEGINNVV